MLLLSIDLTTPRIEKNYSICKNTMNLRPKFLLIVVIRAKEMIYSRSNLNRHIADVHFFLIFDAARQVSTETRIRSRVKCKTSKITKLSKTDKDANQHFQF